VAFDSLGGLCAKVVGIHLLLVKISDSQRIWTNNEECGKINDLLEFKCGCFLLIWKDLDLREVIFDQFEG
jgi:hypothetical protein